MRFGKRATLIQLPFFVLPFAILPVLLWQNAIAIHFDQNTLMWASIAGLASIGDQTITYTLIMKHGDEFVTREWNAFTRIGAHFGRKGLVAVSVMIAGWVTIVSALLGVTTSIVLTTVLLFCISWNTLGWYVLPRLFSIEDEGDT